MTNESTSIHPLHRETWLIFKGLACLIVHPLHRETWLVFKGLACLILCTSQDTSCRKDTDEWKQLSVVFHSEFGLKDIYHSHWIVSIFVDRYR